MVKYLVEEVGVDIHAKDDEALILAAEFDHEHVVYYLLDNGADIYTALVSADIKERIYMLIRYMKKYERDNNINMFTSAVYETDDSDYGG